jgi:hypothetical protein
MDRSVKRANGDEEAPEPPGGGVEGRSLSGVLWWVVPAIFLLGVLALILGVVVRSWQGVTVAGSVAGLLLAYLPLRLWHDRRSVHLEASIEDLRQRTDGLQMALVADSGRDASSPGGDAPPNLEPAISALAELVTEVRITNDQNRDGTAMLRDLVGAVSEYGVHLRSHTAVMQNLATTTQELREATRLLGDSLAQRVAREEAPPALEPMLLGEFASRLERLDLERGDLRARVDSAEARVRRFLRGSAAVLSKLAPWDDDGRRLHREQMLHLVECRRDAAALLLEIRDDRAKFLTLIEQLRRIAPRETGDEEGGTA